MSVTANVIRCPVCCATFSGRGGTPEFRVFADAHQACKGQTFESCPCEWERLCGGMTILARSADPCAQCDIDYPDGSCLKCPGCAECNAPPVVEKRPLEGVAMTVLEVRVSAGLEDAMLLRHLNELERFEATSAGGLSPGERRLRDLLWRRLDVVTR